MMKILNKLLKLNKKKETKPSVYDQIDNLFDDLTVDELSIKVGNDLVDFAEELCNRITQLRNDIADECGYIIPPVRILDDTNMQENQFCIFVRNNPCRVGYVIPTLDEACEEIINELRDVCFEHIDVVFSTALTEKYIERASRNNGGLVYFVTHFLPVTGIKYVLTNLIKNGKSIKDIDNVFAQICEQASKDRDTCYLRNPKIVFERVNAEIK